MQKAHERVLTPQRGPAELSGWGPRSAACLPDACSQRWGLADGGQGLMALCMALSWRCHFTLGSGRARCMCWALVRGTALTEFDLAPCQTHARAVNGPVKPLQPKLQFVAHPVGLSNLYPIFT